MQLPTKDDAVKLTRQQVRDWLDGAEIDELDIALDKAQGDVQETGIDQFVLVQVTGDN